MYAANTVNTFVKRQHTDLCVIIKHAVFDIFLSYNVPDVNSREEEQQGHVRERERVEFEFLEPSNDNRISLQWTQKLVNASSAEWR